MAAAPGGPGAFSYGSQEEVSFPCGLYDIGQHRFVVLAGDRSAPSISKRRLAEGSLPSGG